MSKNYEERRRYKCGDWEYLLDDDDHTAWISKGHTGKQKVYALPTVLNVDGEPYVIESVELFAYAENRYIEELIVPDCYIFVDSDAFSHCKNLKRVYMGKGIETYPYWSFPCCPLEELTIDPQSPYIKLSDDGCMVLTKDGKRLFYCLYDKEGIVVPQTVKVIGTCAISCNTRLKKLTIPKSAMLELDAIFECDNLKTIISI